MSIRAAHLQQYVVEPALRHIGLWSTAAEQLVLGTIAHESACGEFLHQLGKGPAVGIVQMEPVTYRDIITRTVPTLAPAIRDALWSMVPREFEAWPPAEYLAADLRYAAALCRICYFRVPHRLPDACDIDALSLYWKRHYNTYLGAGEPRDFVRAYNRHVKALYPPLTAT